MSSHIVISVFLIWTIILITLILHGDLDRTIYLMPYIVIFIYIYVYSRIQYLMDAFLCLPIFGNCVFGMKLPAKLGRKKKRIAAFLGSFLTSFSKHFIV